MRTRKFWSDVEDALLIDNYQVRGSRWLAEQLDRTRLSIYQRAAKLGLTDRQNFAGDDELRALIRELHPNGFTDAEVKQVASVRFGCNVDRHRVGILRKSLGLAANNLSTRTRQRTAAKTREQLAKAGLKSMAELRVEKFNEWKRDLGWPEELTVRAVQALELFWRHGQLTRFQLCSLMGVSSRKRTAPTSNAPGGTVLGELARAGLIARLKKAVAVKGDLALHQEPCANSRNRKRANETKYIDLYFLNPGVKPNGETRKHAEAG